METARLTSRERSKAAPNRYLIAMLVMAIGIFAVRGTWRGIRHNLTNDFFGIYTISKVWTVGHQPYSTSEIVSTFEKSSGYKLGRNTLPLTKYYSALPGMVPLVAGFSVFKWQTANSIWVLFSSAVFLTGCWVLARQDGAWWRSEAALFLTCCLLLGPVHTGLSGSNITPLLVGLMACSYVLYRKGSWIAAGVLLGLVGCCKPHIAGAMVLLLLAEKAWRVLGVGIATGLVSVAVFAVRLAFAGVHWLAPFIERSRQFGSIGTADDFSLANPARYELLNLQVLVADATPSRILANAIAVAIGVVLVVAWWRATRVRSRTDSILSFAAINVILLLPSYHRFDDATVLVFVFAAILLTKDLRMRIAGIATAAFFALPFPTILVVAESHGWIPSPIFASTAFRLTLLAGQTWFLLYLSTFLLGAMKNSQEQVDVEETASALTADTMSA